MTEGEVTEPIYFETLRRQLAPQAVEIEIVGAGKGDPRTLAEAALAKRKERKKEYSSGKLALTKAPDFDELWIVFDTDVPVAHNRYHDGVAVACSKGIKIAECSPCFEYWLLLHLKYTTTSMDKFADVKPILEKALGQPYAKNCKDSAKLITPLLKKIEVACANAAKIRKSHSSAQTPPPANPSSSVDRLISAICND